MRKICLNSPFFMIVLSLVLNPCVHAQTHASTSIGGGSVNWQWTYAQQGTCPVNGNYRDQEAIWAWTFSNFTVTMNGVTTPTSGTVAYIVSPGQPPYCPPSGPTGYPIFGSVDYAVNFTPQTNGQGSAIQYNRGVFDPNYVVQSIVYAAPGNRSNDSFTNGESDGITSSISDSFTNAAQVTLSGSGSFLGIGGTLSWITGASITTGDSQSFTNTVSNASSVGNQSPGSGSNALSHQQDLFVIWLNPEITTEANSATTANYSIATPTQASGDPSPGRPQGVDSVEVLAANLVNGTVDPITLKPQPMYDPNAGLWYSGPGLASICTNVNLAEYEAGQCTLADQCGCQKSDWTEILSHDVLLDEPNTYNPLNSNTSSSSQCTATGVNSASKCRFVYVGQTTLQGPQCSGCNIPVNSNTWNDSSVGTFTSTESNSETVGFGWRYAFAPGGTGPQLSSQTTFTWTNSESTGKTNGNSHQAQITLSSGTTYCNEPIIVFMDTIYHTFLFQENTNGTCL